MGKKLGIAAKAIGATVVIGILVVGACLFSESSRSYYPGAQAR